MTDTTRPADGHELTEAERVSVRMAVNTVTVAGYPAIYRVVERILAARGADAAVTDDADGATALREAAAAARTETIHGHADKYDWANWLDRRAAVLDAAPAPTEDTYRPCAGCDSIGQSCHAAKCPAVRTAPTVDRADDVVERMRALLSEADEACPGECPHGDCYLVRGLHAALDGVGAGEES